MISVCMTTFNGERYVLEQVASILQQLPGSANDASLAEIIIADDGSSDRTLDVLRNLNDCRIRIIEATSQKLGPIYNLERALKVAQGDYIFLSDQDDIWLPGKVSTMLSLLEQNDLVMHDAVLLKNGAYAERLSEIRKFRKGVLKNWLKNSYTGCCMAFSRNVLKASLPFPRKLPMHDQWIGIVAEKKYSVSFIDEPLIAYRIHENNATQITGKRKGALQRLCWRFWLLVAILGL